MLVLPQLVVLSDRDNDLTRSTFKHVISPHWWHHIPHEIIFYKECSKVVVPQWFHCVSKYFLPGTFLCCPHNMGRFNSKLLWGAFFTALQRHGQLVSKLQQGCYLTGQKVVILLQIVVDFSQVLQPVHILDTRSALFWANSGSVVQQVFVDLLHQRTFCLIAHKGLPPFLCYMSGKPRRDYPMAEKVMCHFFVQFVWQSYIPPFKFTIFVFFTNRLLNAFPFSFKCSILKHTPTEKEGDPCPTSSL